MNYQCLRCTEPYEQQRRRASHFCPACRADRNRERTRDRMRERRTEETTMRDVLDDYVNRGMDADYVAALHPRIDDYLHTLDGNDRALTPDRMPTGANSPAGPNDGTSTYFEDLADDLERRHREAANHPWFAANPHWSYELHNPDAAGQYLNDVA